MLLCLMQIEAAAQELAARQAAEEASREAYMQDMLAREASLQEQASKLNLTLETLQLLQQHAHVQAQQHAQLQQQQVQLQVQQHAHQEEQQAQQHAQLEQVQAQQQAQLHQLQAQLQAQLQPSHWFRNCIRYGSLLVVLLAVLMIVTSA